MLPTNADNPLTDSSEGRHEIHHPGLACGMLMVIPRCKKVESSAKAQPLSKVATVSPKEPRTDAAVIKICSSFKPLETFPLDAVLHRARSEIGYILSFSGTREPRNLPSDSILEQPLIRNHPTSCIFISRDVYCSFKARHDDSALSERITALFSVDGLPKLLGLSAPPGVWLINRTQSPDESSGVPSTASRQRMEVQLCPRGVCRLFYVPLNNNLQVVPDLEIRPSSALFFDALSHCARHSHLGPPGNVHCCSVVALITLRAPKPPACLGILSHRISTRSYGK